MLHRRFTVLALSCFAVFLPGLAGCSFSTEDQRQRDERTRDEAAKATERAKPAIQEAGRQLGRAAEVAAEEAHAAAQGVRQGWSNAQHTLVDLNSASERELLGLPGISKMEARQIIAGRPYQDKHELVTKGIVSGPAYQRIRDLVTAK